MTMRLHAERFSMRLWHRRIHAEDCADRDTQEGDVGNITREITIGGDVPEAAQAKLMESGDRYAVH